MDVVFPVMPFADLGRPALGVSLLQAAAHCLGASSSVIYCNLDLAEWIGCDVYVRIANSFPPDSLIGEWFFADLLFGERLPDPERYIADILGKYSVLLDQFQDIVDARACRESFIDDCVRRIRQCSPRVVGFSTTFHQTCACLAVAERLKESSDPPIVIFGGANCEGEMGEQLLRSFDCIDYVSTREADLSFPAFLREVLDIGAPKPVPGIIGHERPDCDEMPQLVVNLDQLPIPDFRDYFKTLSRSPLGAQIAPELLMETSRGCWWGEKHHCTFCGLNGETMAFRRKSEARVLEEMRSLYAIYGINRIECVDNILDVRFIRTLFPQLAESGLGLELFFEIKANLKLAQLVTLKRGGMKSIQPGIESFSTPVLKLMRKGCTGAQNVQLLRYCEETGIGVAWNILVGFPEEEPIEYDRMADMLPLLAHLPPPASCSQFRLDRFSPFFTQPEALGIQRVRPSPSYYYVFPFGRRELAKLAYFFDFDHTDGRDPQRYTRSVSSTVHQWLSYWSHADRRPRLDAYWNTGGFDILDTRLCAVADRDRLEGVEADIYNVCDSAQSFASLARKLESSYHPEAIIDALERLKRKRLVVEWEGQYLTLAVMRRRKTPEQERAIQREAPAA
jgi:ribosomal peptide maturation radical SAM protein 1